MSHEVGQGCVWIIMESGLGCECGWHSADLGLVPMLSGSYACHGMNRVVVVKCVDEGLGEVCHMVRHDDCERKWKIGGPAAGGERNVGGAVPAVP